MDAPYSDLKHKKKNVLRIFELKKSGCVKYKGLAAFNFSIRNKNKPTTIYHHYFIKKKKKWQAYDLSVRSRISKERILGNLIQTHLKK